jgi:hypothetical protein
MFNKLVSLSLADWATLVSRSYAHGSYIYKCGCYLVTVIRDLSDTFHSFTRLNGYHDTQHNDTQHNDTQKKGLICDTQNK